MAEQTKDMSKSHSNSGRRTKEKEKRDFVMNLRYSSKTKRELENAYEYFCIKAGHRNFSKSDIIIFAIEEFQDRLFKELNNISDARI